MKLALLFTAALVLVLPVSAQQALDEPSVRHSERAMSVLIVAHLEAEQRGASSVDVNDLILALVAEDQDPRAADLFSNDASLEELFSPKYPMSYEPYEKGREPFFSPKVAADTLIKLNEILPRSNSLPPGSEMQTSAAYDRVLKAANELPGELHQGEVEIRSGTDARPPGVYQAVVPLDLLAAALLEPCEGTKLLQAAGVTEEKVLQVLRTKGADLENGSFRLEPPQPDAQTPRR